MQRTEKRMDPVGGPTRRAAKRRQPGHRVGDDGRPLHIEAHPQSVDGGGQVDGRDAEVERWAQGGQREGGVDVESEVLHNYGRLRRCWALATNNAVFWSSSMSVRAANSVIVARPSATG